ncbi:MAG TPA: nuclear transport factor 2 family protein [Steroidobacteraceae bacterium]|nr:nuclear transport factor 2 family protein [Steroidobacteraceae bacterium]
MRAEQALKAYVDAVASANVDAARALFAPRARLEMPLLGQTLFGQEEIRAGLERIAHVTLECRYELRRLKSTDTLALAEGLLEARLRNGGEVRRSMALVVVMAAEGIERLSSYLDTFDHRLWSDGLITARPLA